MAKKKHPPKHVQKQIAEESVSSQERRELRRAISTLKRLPEDFRDISAGSRDWEAFATITGRRKEMEAWDNGPIIYLARLNASEKMILGSQNELYRTVSVDNGKKLVQGNWYMLLQEAVDIDASWIYLPDEEPETITALNVLFSRFGYNVRAKGRLMSEHSGKPVGVVR